MAREQDGPFEVETSEGLVFAERTGLALDLYRPLGAGRVPATLHLPGGAWAAGSRADAADRARRVAALGVAVAVADYRHTPEWVFPAQWEDAAAAAGWMREHAGELGLAPRLGAWGASAGGHLAALLATPPPADAAGPVTAGPLVDAACCWFAPLAFTERRRRTPLEERLASPSAETALVRGVPEPLAREADPYERAGAGASPFLLVHGDRDHLVPHSHALRFHDRLSAAGVPCETTILSGAGHEDPVFDGEAELARVAAFLRRTLAP